MRSIALGLDLPEHFFDASIDEKCHNLRLLSYPPMKTSLLREEGQYRAGAHSGSGFFLHLPPTPSHKCCRLWFHHAPVPGLHRWFRSSESAEWRIYPSFTHGKSPRHGLCQFITNLRMGLSL